VDGHKDEKIKTEDVNKVGAEYIVSHEYPAYRNQMKFILENRKLATKENLKDWFGATTQWINDFKGAQDIKGDMTEEQMLKHISIQGIANHLGGTTYVLGRILSKGAVQTRRYVKYTDTKMIVDYPDYNFDTSDDAKVIFKKPKK